MELDELVGRTDYLEVVVPLSESDVSLAQKRELTRHFLDVSAICPCEHGSVNASHSRLFDNQMSLHILLTLVAPWSYDVLSVDQCRLMPYCRRLTSTGSRQGSALRSLTASLRESIGSALLVGPRGEWPEASGLRSRSKCPSSCRLLGPHLVLLDIAQPCAKQ